MATAKRIDSDWNFAEETRFMEEAEGDVQVISATRRNGKGIPFRAVNAYFQSVLGRGGGPRPARRAQWDFLLEETSTLPCVIGGDFNAHSPRWNNRCRIRQNATFLEDLIDQYTLSILND